MDAPAGAWASNPLLAGRGDFHFDARYDRKHDTAPKGKGRFRFKALGKKPLEFDFESTALDSLVVDGTAGQLAGSGRIDRAGDYGFLVTFADDKPGAKGARDKFRIKLWGRSSGAVVYDDVPGAPDDLDAARPGPVDSGHVTIHLHK